jgi:hypothetical protein
MKTKTLDPKIAHAYRHILRNDVVIGFVMLIPTAYIVYAVFNWHKILKNPVCLDLFWIALALVAINVVVEMLNWKCPKCKVFLGMVFNPKYCPHCGVQLRG